MGPGDEGPKKPFSAQKRSKKVKIFRIFLISFIAFDVFLGPFLTIVGTFEPFLALLAPI